MKVITESGTAYIIAGGFWSRNGAPRKRLLTFLSIPNDPVTWDEVFEAKLPAPQVGYCMYLSNFHEWQTSTPVVSVEE